MATFWLNSEDLVTSVKRRAMIPIDQNTFSDQDILDFANEEMQQNILPMIFQFHEEYLAATANIPIVVGQQAYEVPYRAIGGKFRNVAFLDGTSPTAIIREMVRIDPKDQPFYNGLTNGNIFQRFYYMVGNELILSSVPDQSNGFLNVSYYQRPGLLVTSDRIATVTAMATSGLNTIYSCNQVPSNLAEGTMIDFLQTLPGHDTWKYDYTLPRGSINTVAATITIPTSDAPSSMSVGDCICTTQEAFIPQIPDELHSILAQMTAIKCLEALGDAQGVSTAAANLEKMKSVVGALIDNRVESSPIRIMNTASPLRMSRFFRFFRVGY